MTTRVLRNVLALLFVSNAQYSSCGDTNSASSKAGPITTKSCAEDSILQRSAMIHRIDKEGLSEYQSERDIELQRFGLATSPTNGSPAPALTRVSQCLLHMPRPTESHTPSPPIGDEKVRRELANMGVIPVWSGKAWIDGSPLAMNGYAVKEQVEQKLVNLNYADALSRFFSGPDGDLLGGARSQVHVTRMSLLNLGYELKYDKTFGIWRITGTNAPAASKTP